MARAQSDLEKSYACGTSAEPLIGDTIGARLDRSAARWHDCEALVVRHQDIRWTYAELKARVDAFSTGLLALGLDKGDRIGIWSPNNAEWILTQLAAAKTGLILVNINPAYRLAELEYAINKVGCKALVVAARFKTSDYLAMLAALAPEIAESALGKLKSHRLPTLRTLILIGSAKASGYVNFDDVPKLGGDAERLRLSEVETSLQFDDPINIQFTSGTTGNPKGATLTHHNILNNGYLVGQRMNVSATDRLCLPVPLYHCFGMVMGVLCCITHGMTIVLPAPSFDARATLEAIAAERCTAVYGVPTMFVAMLAEMQHHSFDLASLRTGIMAGAPCPIDVMRRIIADMNIGDMTIAYGMTETGPVNTQTAIDDSLERRVATVGRVQPHTEIKIVDELGRIVPRGAIGELCSRGYLVMQGYWGDDERTRESIDDAGWMHSGDLAVLDADGYCTIVGRIKDMVIRGGENIYPREIEEFLHRHPAIELAQVFGVPDDKYGEELCAWVKLRADTNATADEIRGFCSGQIAHMKIPRYVEIVEAFPMTVTGKFQKFLMREEMVEKLGLRTQKTA